MDPYLGQDYLRWATYFHFGKHVGGSETGSFTYEFIIEATFNKKRSAFDYGLSLDYMLARRCFCFESILPCSAHEGIGVHQAVESLGPNESYS